MISSRVYIYQFSMLMVRLHKTFWTKDTGYNDLFSMILATVLDWGEVLHIILVTSVIKWQHLFMFPKNIKRDFLHQKSGLAFLFQKPWQGRSLHLVVCMGCDDAWSSHSTLKLDYEIIACFLYIGCGDA